MNVTCYSYSKCSTCQKALNFLRQSKIECVVKEITLTPPTLKELHQMLAYQGGNLKKLFNTSGILYREMKLTEKLQEMSLEQAMGLLASNGMLIKRPFLLSHQFGLVGFSEKEWVKVFTGLMS